GSLDGGRERAQLLRHAVHHLRPAEAPRRRPAARARIPQVLDAPLVVPDDLRQASHTRLLGAARLPHRRAAPPAARRPAIARPVQLRLCRLLVNMSPVAPIYPPRTRRRHTEALVFFWPPPCSST